MIAAQLLRQSQRSLNSYRICISIRNCDDENTINASVEVTQNIIRIDSCSSTSDTIKNKNRHVNKQQTIIIT